MMETCIVGYALHAKKMRKGSSVGVQRAANEGWCGGGLADILNTSEMSQGVVFKPFNADSDNKYDVIIHKLTDMETEETKLKLNSIDAYLKGHPSTVIIDSPLSIRKITSRSRACECMENVLSAYSVCDRPFHLPPFCVLNDKSELQKKLRQYQLHYPVICKPIDACGTPLSHLMAVLVCDEDVGLIPSFPCIVQQYYNHSGRFYKVYVMDPDVMVYERVSLPNLEIAKYPSQPVPGRGTGSVTEYPDSASRSHCTRSVSFDSRLPYPKWEDFHCSASCQSCTPGHESPTLVRVIDTPLMNRCREAAHILRDEFQLSLFGFDVILPESVEDRHAPHPSAPELFIIDVNFFPSYKEVTDFPMRLNAFLRRKAGLPPWEDPM